MKRILVSLFMVSFILVAFSCNKKEVEKIPRDVYTSSSDGAVLKKSPNDSAERAGTLPFGWKITVTEKLPQKEKDQIGNDTWYKTSWNGSDAWIKSSSFSGTEEYNAVIEKRFSESKLNINNDFLKFFSPMKTEGSRRFIYTGGEMEPACITLLPGGGMIVSSKIFSEDYRNYYFAYELLNGEKLIKIIFVDNRLNFKDFADIESSSTSVFKIDRNERSITYHIKNGSFFFMNWGFKADTKL